MKILITIPSTRPSHGGTSRSAPYLANALARSGAEVHLATANPAGVGRPDYLSQEVYYHCLEEKTWFQRTFRSPLRYRKYLDAKVREVGPDLLHDQAAWLPGNRAASLAARDYGIPLVISPRGLLRRRALDHHRWRKKLAWWTYQRRVLQRADLIHAASMAEKEDLLELGVQQEVAVIPNGVSFPDKAGMEDRSPWPKKVLFLSRFDPLKGLPLLLKAWELADTGEWTLELAGSGGERYVRYISFLVDKMEDGSVSLSGPVEERRKWEVYHSAGLFVLPSYSENFGIVVAEAMVSGLPVITTTATPWQELRSHDCGWWIEPKLDDMVGTLERALNTKEAQLDKMGQRGRELVRERYDWDRIAARMINEYEKLVTS